MSELKTATTLPECWGHRGASAAFPENSLASFEAAIRDGAEGIESVQLRLVDTDNVHSLDVTRLACSVMFHDPSLERTTNMKAIIRESNWHGDDGIHQARTRKSPVQAIPTFAQSIELLMKPENRHVKFNVDVKVQNDPDRLFRLMHEVISAQENWEKDLAPRILLGLWHPKFIEPAKKHLPYVRRAHIGMSPAFAKKWFWESCETFSMNFSALVTAEGEAFRRDCKEAGKSIAVWTVNAKEEMMQSYLLKAGGPFEYFPSTPSTRVTASA
ncbi:hypothetical protein FRC00_010711 [Tulasnella sp. 408]|nr:hypothetical protein FRC00_010711 [Tulasnella sp. 408]